MNWTKFKQSFDVFLFLIAVLGGNALIIASWHNLDLLNNYALLFSDINQLEHCNDNFYEVRELKECNLFGCDEFSQVYQESKTAEMIGVVLLNGVIIEFIVRKWKKSQS